MKNDSEQTWRGIGIATGIAIGPAYVIDQTGLTVPEYAILANQVEKEIKRFRTALAKAQRQLSQLKQKAESLPAGAAKDVALLLDAYQGMLSGSRLVRGVEDLIEKNRINAEAAIQRQITALKASFAKMDDAYLTNPTNYELPVNYRIAAITRLLDDCPVEGLQSDAQHRPVDFFE